MTRPGCFALVCYGLATVLPVRGCCADTQTPPLGTTLADNDRQGPFLAVTEENDLFGTPLGRNTDRHYTQGLKITWLNGDDDLPQWARKVSDDLPQVGL